MGGQKLAADNPCYVGGSLQPTGAPSPKHRLPRLSCPTLILCPLIRDGRVPKREARLPAQQPTIPRPPREAFLPVLDSSQIAPIRRTGPVSPLGALGPSGKYSRRSETSQKHGDIQLSGGQWYGNTSLTLAKDSFSGFAVSMFPSK